MLLLYTDHCGKLFFFFFQVPWPLRQQHLKGCFWSVDDCWQFLSQCSLGKSNQDPGKGIFQSFGWRHQLLDCQQHQSHPDQRRFRHCWEGQLPTQEFPKQRTCSIPEQFCLFDSISRPRAPHFREVSRKEVALQRRAFCRPQRWPLCRLWWNWKDLNPLIIFYLSILVLATGLASETYSYIYLV